MTTVTSARRTTPGLIIAGIVLALFGLPLLLAGLGLAAGLAFQRDDAGFFTGPATRLSSPTAALTTQDYRLGQPGADDWWADRELATVRITATAAAEGAVFVGIAPSADAAAYLAGAAHDEVATMTAEASDVRLTRRGGAVAALSAPAEQAGWVAQAVGAGTQELVWTLQPGTYTAVVMNADGRPGIDVTVAVAGKIDLLTPVAVGLIIAGLALVVVAALLIVYGSTAPPAPAVEQGPGPVTGHGRQVVSPADTGSPVVLTGYRDEPLSRGLWLIKWFLALPHLIILAGLWVVFLVLTLVAFVAILVTGRYPDGAFRVNTGILRWAWRVQFYATSALGTDRYPPFSLNPADYPASLDIRPPARLSRGLVLVKSWLLALPHLIIVAILAGSWGWTTGEDDPRLTIGGLIGALTLAAGLMLLITGRYPPALFDFNIGLNRWVYRVIAYVALMTDEYPPFRLDQGPAEPTSVAPSGPDEPETGPQATAPAGGP